MGGATAAADADHTSSGTTTSSQNAGGSGGSPLQKSLQDAVRNITVSITAGLNPQHEKTGQSGSDPALADAAAEDATGDSAMAESAAATHDEDTTASVPESAPADDSADAAAGSVAAVSATAVAPVAPVTVADSTGPSGSSTTTPAVRGHPVASTASQPAPESHPATSAEPPVAASPVRANLLQPAAVVITSAMNLTVAVGDAVVTLPALIVSLLNSPTPVTDVIGYLQSTLTSVRDSLIPLASVPAGVAAALLALGATTPTAGISHLGPALRNIALDVTQTPTTPTTSSTQVPLPVNNAVMFAISGGFAAPASLTAPTRPAAVPPALAEAPHSTMPYITGALAALLISASLWALFTAALPGMGGLAAIGATGMRIGYRQAKAGTAVYRTDLARFAPRGPIGVVRSDSLVAVHTGSARRFRSGESVVKPRLRSVDSAA